MDYEGAPAPAGALTAAAPRTQYVPTFGIRANRAHRALR